VGYDINERTRTGAIARRLMAGFRRHNWVVADTDTLYRLACLKLKGAGPKRRKKRASD
jgi:hypothetical protein